MFFIKVRISGLWNLSPIKLCLEPTFGELFWKNIGKQLTKVSVFDQRFSFPCNMLHIQKCFKKRAVLDLDLGASFSDSFFFFLIL